MRALHQNENMKGFTLIEVLLVVVIIGILSAISLSVVGDKIVHDRLKGTAKQVKIFIDQAVQKVRMSQSEWSIGLATNASEIKLFESADCSGSATQTTSIDANISIKTTSNHTTCSSGNTWTSQNGFYCLTFDEDAATYPVNVGCFELQYEGNTEVSSGVVKQGSKNFVQSFFQNNGSLWWLQ